MNAPGKKILVVVDQTPECLKALRYAAKRAQRVGGGVSMLYVLEPDEFQHWRTVADAMRQEAHERASARMTALSAEVKAIAGVEPETTIREGVRREQVIEHLRADPDICALVLGAGGNGKSEGPGPLVVSLAGQMSGTMPVPVTVVPGALSSQEIDAVC